MRVLLCALAVAALVAGCGDDEAEECEGAGPFACLAFAVEGFEQRGWNANSRSSFTELLRQRRITLPEIETSETPAAFASCLQRTESGVMCIPAITPGRIQNVTCPPIPTGLPDVVGMVSPLAGDLLTAAESEDAGEAVAQVGRSRFCRLVDEMRDQAVREAHADELEIEPEQLDEHVQRIQRLLNEDEIADMVTANPTAVVRWIDEIAPANVPRIRPFRLRVCRLKWGIRVPCGAG